MKVGLYIDMPNLFPSAVLCGKRAGMVKPRLDLLKLRDGLVEGNECVIAALYVVVRGGAEKDTFLAKMRASGFKVRSKEVREEKQIASWESAIGMQMLRESDLWDKCVLVSGNGALAPFVDTLTGRGKRVHVACFPDSASPSLLVSASDSSWLGEKDLFDAR